MIPPADIQRRALNHAKTAQNSSPLAFQKGVGADLPAFHWRGECDLRPFRQAEIDMRRAGRSLPTDFATCHYAAFAYPARALADPVVWANHLSIEADRLLVERVFPDRRGFLLAIDPQCKPVLIPLDDPAAESIPDARVAGIDEVVAELRGGPSASR